MCAYVFCVQLSYTTQHRTVLILHTIIIAQTMSTEGEGKTATETEVGRLHYIENLSDSINWFLFRDHIHSS